MGNKKIVNYLVFKNNLTCIFQFRRPPLAPKGAPLLKDVEFAITWKNGVTRLDLRGSSTKCFY